MNHLQARGIPLQFLLDSIPAGALLVNSAGVIVALNSELAQQFGYAQADLLGEAIECLVPGNLREEHVRSRLQFTDLPRARTMGSGELIHGRRKDGSTFPIEVGLRALEGDHRPLVLAVVSRISERERIKSLEASERALGLELVHQETLAREMGHRVKNLMATLMALISLSARGAETPKALEESLRGRMLALSSIIDLAFRSPDAAAQRGRLAMGEIVATILAPFALSGQRGDRLSMEGPPLVVGERAAEVLALVFHELTTNAVKYGSLRHLDGRLRIAWKQVGENLELCWSEQGREGVSSGPVRMGFGSSLIARMIEMQLGGTVERDATASGWTIRLTIPTASLQS